MNCNEFKYNYNPRGRNRNVRGRGMRAINIQRPTIGGVGRISTKRAASTNPTSSTSSIKWKNQSSMSINNVTTTVTKSTSSKTFSTSYCDSKVVIAIAAGRGEAACEIGIAALDIGKPTLIMCQISDTSSYINTLTKINVLNPDEILLPMTLIDSANSNRLLSKIKHHFKNVIITAVPRASYNKVAGLQSIKELCAPEWDSIVIVLQHKFYCLTAAAALLTYTETSLCVVYNKKSLKVEYQESEGYCIIDVSTADKLELVNSNSVTSNERYSSLYGILNYCFTRIGARALRTAILQPSCSVPDIEARLDCITELKRNPDMMNSIKTILPRISNIDNLLSLATLPSEQGENYNERHLTYVLTLNVLLDLLEPLRELFQDSELPFFKEIRSTLDNESFNNLKHELRSMIQPDAHPAKGQQAIFEKCFLIKPGVNGLLDVLRKTFSERIEDLREYVNQLRDKYNLPLALGNNSKKGYHITLQLNSYTKKTFKKSELPAEFIQVDRLHSSVTMKTTNLINLASRIDAILQETLKMSSVMVYQILVKVRNHIGLFYKLCEDVAKLDVIQSLAQASDGIGYIRPEFGDYLDITNSKHPLLDFLCSTEPVANSIFASRDHNVHIITGPNGSGKSVFIRQVLLLQVMAQIGSFIPAEAAVVRVCDRMVARVFFDDNMDCGASAFVLEIKEIQYLHTVLSPNTLIIIDELCRSTAVSEGTALAMAIMEAFSKSQAFIYLATHYIFVTRLEEFYPNVTNWQMECVDGGDNRRGLLKFTYSLISGITSFKKYGLGVASVSWPKEIVDAAEELYDQLEPPKKHAKVEGLNILERLKYNLEAQLKMLKSKKQLTSDVLQQTMAVYVENLKQIGVDIMDYMPEGSFHIDDNANITFQMNKSGELPFVLPEAVYSPAVTNVEDPEGNYQQFCQEIQARNLEVEHPSFFESESQNDAALSLMISQNFNRIVENRSKINSNDVHEVSGSFKCPNSSIPWRSNTLSNIQSREQNSFDLDSMERSKSVEDPNVSGALEDLQECSSYFTQDWDELDGNPKESEVMERTSAVDVEKSPPKSNVVIQTVHIFDQNDQLLKVQRFDRETGALIEKNSQEDCLDKIEGRSNYSDESFHFAKAGDNSISINNATFLTSEDKVNFEELKQDFDANSDRSFVMNFATPISGKTKSIDDLNRPQLQSNNDQSFRMDFQGKPLKIDSQKRFFEATREKDLTNQNTILTSDSNSFYSLRTNTEDTKQFNYNSQRSSITQFKEISSKPNSQISQKESIFDILNEMQRSKSLETREHFSNISGTNNSRISSLTNSLRFTTLNRKDFSQKTYSNTFFEIQARNDALRIQKSKEIAAKSSLEPTDSKGLQNKANSSNLISEKSSKDSEDAGNVNNTNIWGETQENTFDSHCSTLKLYPNRSLNTSGVGQNKRIEDFDRSNSNLLEISNENGEMTAKVLCNDIFNTSGKRQTEGFDNLNRSNSSLFKISKRKEKISPQKMFQEEFLNTSGVSQTEELEGFNRSNNNLIKIANKKKKINPNVSCEDVFNASGISQTEEFENFNRSSSILEKSFVSGKYQIETFENLNRSNSNLFKIISKKEKSSPKALNEDALNTSGMNQTERFENFNQINSKLLENAQEDDKISPKIIYKHVSNTSGVSKTQRFKNFNGNSDIFSKSIETDEEINAKFSYKDMSNISGVSQTENFENVDGSSNNFPKITKNDEKINSKVSHKDVLDSYGISLNDFNRTNSNFLEITNENDKLGSKILNEDVFNISRTSQSKRFENFGQNRSDSFQSINENEKTSQNVKCKDILEANQRKNEQNFHSGIDTEIKKSSQNLILAKILLNKIQKGNNMVKEQNIDGLNNTATSNVIETSQNLNDDRFEKISKSLKRYFKPVENEKIVENQTISLKSFEAKSNTKSIFETTNGSESLFSSQDAFFSALDTSVSKPKTPEKPVVKKKLCKRKFVPPWKTDGSEAETSKAPRGRVKRPRRKTSFVPPRKLSKKEILNDYDRQRIKVLENADDPGQIEEYLNFINNRPNVQQIQEQQYLALIKRTSDGMEILPPKSPVIKPKKTAIPLERKLSENEFHKILSDGNEDKLKSLLKTQEKMFDFDDTKPNLEFFKENDEKTQHSEFTPAFGSLFDNNVIEDIIKKYLE